MTITNSYYVPVYTSNNNQEIALISPATKQDMPTNWKCAWKTIWETTCFECEAIIKISYKEEVFGLMRIALYPYTDDDFYNPKYLEIRNIEAIPRDNRIVNPIGFWLIWYAADIALKVFQCDPDKRIVELDSLEESISYYRDKVGMDELGWVTTAPGEEGYAFGFTKKGAAEFCQRQESVCGSPTQFS